MERSGQSGAFVLRLRSRAFARVAIAAATEHQCAPRRQDAALARAKVMATAGGTGAAARRVRGYAPGIECSGWRIVRRLVKLRRLDDCGSRCGASAQPKLSARLASEGVSSGPLRAKHAGPHQRAAVQG